MGWQTKEWRPTAVTRFIKYRDTSATPVFVDTDAGEGVLKESARKPGGQYTKCMISKRPRSVDLGFARSKHWVSDEGDCSVAGNNVDFTGPFRVRPPTSWRSPRTSSTPASV